MLGTKGNWEGASHVGNTPEVEQLAPEMDWDPKGKNPLPVPVPSFSRGDVLYNFLGV